MSYESGRGSERSRSEDMDRAADTAKQRGQEVAQRGAEQADAQRERAAEQVGKASETVRQRGQDMPGGEATTRASEKAADTLDRAGEYLQEHQVSDILEDLQRFARAHPTESMIAAGVLGLLLGRALRG